MFHDKVEEPLSEFGQLASIKGLGNKAPEHTLRVATVLAGFDAPEISNFSRISDGYIRNSIILTQYYLMVFCYLCRLRIGISLCVSLQSDAFLQWLIFS